MITDKVIKEIYKTYNRDRNIREELDVKQYIDMLKSHHSIQIRGDELVIDDLDESNPFRRVLLRRLRTILEFDKKVAFVLSNHIIFFEKKTNEIHVHLKPEKKRGFFFRLFHPKENF